MFLHRVAFKGHVTQKRLVGAFLLKFPFISVGSSIFGAVFFNSPNLLQAGIFYIATEVHHPSVNTFLDVMVPFTWAPPS